MLAEFVKNKRNDPLAIVGAAVQLMRQTGDADERHLAEVIDAGIRAALQRMGHRGRGLIIPGLPH
jgi:hypothetical protein